ncbi:hypothetical protein HMPREF1356_02258 [Enterococcus faecium C1904]|nr:hypothetical protein HMPREF1356_02258 [Enterococcus faecium C1904]
MPCLIGFFEVTGSLVSLYFVLILKFAFFSKAVITIASYNNVV